MIKMLKQIWRQEEGQDLIEYTLLLAFVALVAAGLFIQAGNVTAGIWGQAYNRLQSASTAAAS
ncbi:MAG TPA: hypothetical protein VKT49_04885 [Bryobacteraceae bacterium]|nr:hypothetical protein [Bryobacteraceae bacterium]